MKPDRYRLHTIPDRYQPALLDRLTDTEPRRLTESAAAMVMTQAQLRHSVLRDLRWLLNTLNLESAHDLEGCEHVKTSTLNYGVCVLAGRRMSEVDWLDLEHALTRAILAFEPRILPDTLEVRCDADADMLQHHNVIHLDIQGMLWCLPQPQTFHFRTEIDLESGRFDLADAQGAS